MAFCSSSGSLAASYAFDMPAEMSETDTEALINTGLPGDRSTWNTRQWAIYTLRRMMYVVDALSYDDVQAMVLCCLLRLFLGFCRHLLRHLLRYFFGF